MAQVVLHNECISNTRIDSSAPPPPSIINRNWLSCLKLVPWLVGPLKNNQESTTVYKWLTYSCLPSLRWESVSTLEKMTHFNFNVSLHRMAVVLCSWEADLWWSGMNVALHLLSVMTALLREPKSSEKSDGERVYVWAASCSHVSHTVWGLIFPLQHVWIMIRGKDPSSLS